MSVLINLSAMFDDAKCIELVCQTRRPQCFRYPKCGGEYVVRDSHVDRQPHRQRYRCNECQFRFDDLSDTALAAAIISHHAFGYYACISRGCICRTDKSQRR